MKDIHWHVSNDRFEGEFNAPSARAARRQFRKRFRLDKQAECVAKKGGKQE